MSPNYKKLFWKVMDWGCSEPICNVYHKIQKTQSKNNSIPYQLPEPWSGDLENAKIIFVGLNPSFNPQEFFPKNDNPIPNTNYPTYPSPYWTNYGKPHSLCGFKIDETKVEDFFENRFSGSVNGKKYVNNNLQTLQDDGKYSKSVPYWKFVQNVMNYELKTVFNQSKEGKMGEDCALMEIVPCKSKGCVGNNSKPYDPKGKTCIEDFTDKIIKKNLSLLLDGKERLFVFVGKESCEVWYDLLKQYYGGVSRFSFDHIWYAHTNELLYIPGTNIKVVFAPHPSRGNNSINKYIYCRSKAPISF